MDPNLIDAADIRQAAAAVDLVLQPSQVTGVTVYFRMIAAQAALVNAFPLDPECESAVVFKPCSAPTQV